MPLSDERIVRGMSHTLPHSKWDIVIVIICFGIGIARLDMRLSQEQRDIVVLLFTSCRLGDRRSISRGEDLHRLGVGYRDRETKRSGGEQLIRWEGCKVGIERQDRFGR